MASFGTLFAVFGRIGLLSFGGPAAQIALMHRELVDTRSWMTEAQFLRALSFCMLLPGPEAMQLATYAGWKLRGIWGGVLAGTLFFAPGAVVIAVLALLYASHGAQPETEALLLGVKACVIVIVVQALWRLSQKALKGENDLWLAALAFVALFVFGLPFPIVIACAAAWGALRALPGGEQGIADDEKAPKHIAASTIAVWTVLWLAPLPLLWISGHTLLFDLAMFFAKLAVVTFGGAYAVLAYMAQEVVEIRGWLTAPEMVDALGLAETTPGPLILVTQFVGQLAGHAQGGAGLALAAAAVTLWMTFVPCFLWIFAFAPHVESLLSRPRLKAALAAITAAVVGVIANLSLWFAMHVFFAEVSDWTLGPASLALPVLASLRWSVLPLIALAALCFWRGLGVPITLAVTAALSWAMSFA